MTDPDYSSGSEMWKRFKTEGLVVDTELQEILKAMKYDNLSVLAKFSKDDEDSIVSFMRTTYHKLIKIEERTKVYGIFSTNPDLFGFVGGQKKTIGFIAQMAKKLVTLSQQKTVAKLFKGSCSTKNITTTEESMAGKIVDYTTQLEKSINKYLNENFEGTFNIQNVQVAQDGLGSFIAKTPCPVCPKETKITRNLTRWNTSNYYSHLRTHISAQPTNEKNSPTLDKFVIKSPSNATTRNSSVKRRLVPRPEFGKKKQSKVTERWDNSDEEEMLQVFESSEYSDDNDLDQDLNNTSQPPNDDENKENSERKKDQEDKEDGDTEEEDGEGKIKREKVKEALPKIRIFHKRRK